MSWIDNELAEADRIAGVAINLAATSADLVKRAERRELVWVAKGDCGLQTRMRFSSAARMEFAAGQTTHPHTVRLGLGEPEETAMYLLRSLTVPGNDNARVRAETEERRDLAAAVD